MHELRTAILAGDVETIRNPVARKESCRRRGAGASLVGIAIPRVERRLTDQRREDRFPGLVERATIVFRRKRTLVRVVNVSRGGVMVECPVVPRIGETIGVEIDGWPAIEGVVRWVREGRVGLDVGEDSIDLG